MRTAAEQMACDERLAQDGEPALRLFCWDPPAWSFGWKQLLPEWLDEERLMTRGIEAVERPTGGGLACHGSDLSCAIVVPCRAGQSLRQLMGAVGEVVIDVCRSFGVQASRGPHVVSDRRITVCLTEPSSYAVYIGERKLAGFAVRRYPTSWLIQGSVLVRPLPDHLLDPLPVTIREQLTTRAISLSEAAGTLVLERELARQWVACWPSIAQAGEWTREVPRGRWRMMDESFTPEDLAPLAPHLPMGAPDESSADAVRLEADGLSTIGTTLAHPPAVGTRTRSFPECNR